MQIKSTRIQNRSTHGTNHSTEGSNESIKHQGDPGAHFTRHSVARGNPGKSTITPEIDYAYRNKPGISGGIRRSAGMKVDRQTGAIC